MLLRFGLQNHLSMRDKQEISLVASALRDTEEGLIDLPAGVPGRGLPAAVIYGANASGKSNLVSGLQFMRSAVLFSHQRGDRGTGIPRAPFALDPACRAAPSSFDIDFVIDGIRHHYGFQASDEAFLAEWLFAFPHGRRQTLFEREEQIFEFGRSLKGRNRIISELTRPNSLFLSAATQNDHDYLSKISSFFRSMQIDTALSVSGNSAAAFFRDREPDERAMSFLERIGTGVIGFRKVEQPVHLAGLLPLNQGALSSHLEAVNTEIHAPSDAYSEKLDVIEFEHRGIDGGSAFFKLSRESSGTRRLFILLDEAFHALDHGTLLLIDELDASLHTLACESLLALFATKKTNPKGAQIVATTHDTNLLRCNFLRRDAIWFTEKDTGGATDLYPLSDIRTRSTDNFERGYLQGRYGAIPFAGDIAELISAD
jgi:hypothetical protein